MSGRSPSRWCLLAAIILPGKWLSDESKHQAMGHVPCRIWPGACCHPTQVGADYSKHQTMSHVGQRLMLSPDWGRVSWWQVSWSIRPEPGKTGLKRSSCSSPLHRNRAYIQLWLHFALGTQQMSQNPPQTCGKCFQPQWFLPNQEWLGQPPT